MSFKSQKSESIIFDSHVHSSFSTDSTMPAEEACVAAISQGFSGITFTDHLDLDFPGDSGDFNIDFSEYINEINILKDNFKNVFEIGIGIETGYQFHVNEETQNIVLRHLDAFDIIINSIHVINGMDPYDRAYYIEKSKNDAYSFMLKAILKSILNVEYYDVIGHLEFVARMAPYEDRSLLYSEFHEIIDEILKKIIEKGKGLELNTGSIRLKEGISGSFSFDKAIYSRYRELGGEIVTIGSDSHNINHIIREDFIIAVDFLKNCGFKYYTYFRKRKPVFISL